MLNRYPGINGTGPQTHLVPPRKEFLGDAVNDYAGQYDRVHITSPDPILKHIDLELYSALEQWSDRPELQRPEWPHDVGF